MKRKPAGHQPSINLIFNRFVGKEVQMVTEEKTMRIGCVIKKGTVTMPADNDPVLKEMHDEAAKNGLQLRVMWPGQASTPDTVLERVTTHIEKDSAGKWRIKNKFDIG